MIPGELMDSRFRLRDRLGAGGMSVVWRAHDEVLGRDVAVKVLAAELAEDSLLLDRIRAEARAVARLRHPNIVDVYDYGEVPGPGGAPLPYVVMEVVEGRSLSQLLTGGALPWRLAVVICAQVAAALAAAHDRGVVHRDVKPGNVVVAATGVKLVDFGISATSGDDDRAAGEVLGTPAYLAPERLENGVVRPATDVYALGLLLYRALAGRLPWQASTTTQMLRAHRYQEPAPLPAPAGLPAEVAALCRRCLAKDPQQRPTATEAATVLAKVAGLTRAGLRLPGEVSTPLLPTTPAARTGWLNGLAARTGRLGSLTARTGPLGATARAWRARPRHQRIAVLAGAAVLLTGGAVAAAMPGEPSGPRAQASGPAITTAPSAPAPHCAVGYRVAEAAGGRFATSVSVANTGAVPIAAGQLDFTLPDEQRLLTGTPGDWRQSGRTVSAHIGDLPPGETRTASIRGTYQDVNALPDSFRLNGTTCRASYSIAGATTPPTSRPATTQRLSRPAAAPPAAAPPRPATPGKAAPPAKPDKNKKEKKANKKP
ncbi:serine/threonine-protein kinase [Actinoplanes siamensis]|uniref:non-specific serine/threonine protein kinase n=1 Tax=Actinoplanes siamensis TaxID=1223317 RepID=A0A919TKB9_9ACTN|nr:serine/threonine-protein kinase [Actinoplanes siamensis]GIF05183.1 hypothetical protein Asi03nite_27210 [Actinoplanes siamensis]